MSIPAKSLVSNLVRNCKSARVDDHIRCVEIGSALLAKAGVLDGHRATSNKQLFALATNQSDKVTWVEAARWVDDGPVVTSSGVSAGTDMGVAIIQRFWGEEMAHTVAEFAEYTWHKLPPTKFGIRSVSVPDAFAPEKTCYSSAAY